MAIYSTFFACDPTSLAGAFPDWKAPLAVPVQRSFKNPFTGATQLEMTDEPTWEEEPKPGWAGRALSALGLRRAAPASERAMTVVAVRASDYSSYLESRVPEGVRALPHYCTKGLAQLELEPLGAVLGVVPALQAALYSRPSASSMLFRI